MAKLSENKVTKAGKLGWTIANDSVDFFLTCQGGHTAPVVFSFQDGKKVDPYFVSHWQESNIDLSAAPILEPLRGDFFCLPFGGNGEPVDGKSYPCHGESACCNWSFFDSYKEADSTVLKLAMDMKISEGRIEKTIELKDGQTNLYIEDKVTNLEGSFPIGHHAILKFPEENEKAYLAVGDFELGMTHPGIFSDPVNLEHGALASGEEFSDITKIPSKFKNPETIDYSVYPSPIGYTDIWAVFKKESSTPGWSCVSFPERGYMWFVLKDTKVLPGTAMWVANSGRYGSPWDGKTRCLGVEDCCSYFACGIKDSISENELTKKGWKTAVKFIKDEAVSVKTIQGCVAIPANFTKVARVEFLPGKIQFTDENGQVVETNCNWEFIG